jgi:hypothetical protein
MNLVQKGCCRDKEIIKTLENKRALNTKQIAVLFFDFKTGYKKAQQRMTILHKRKRVKRKQVSKNEPYVYYVGNKPGLLEHLIATNWVYIWFLKRLANWEELWYWDYEKKCDALRYDAFCGIYNSVVKENKFWFVEVDRSDNDFDKVQKYNKLYSTQGYKNFWWVQKTKRFPSILIVTEQYNRLEKIKDLILRNNTNGLRFKVMLLSEIIEEAIANAKCSWNRPSDS